MDSYTDLEWAAAEQAMREAGRQAGHAAGTRAIDGNTSEAECRRIVQAIEDGEEVLVASGPFSGASGPMGWFSPEVIEAETELDPESLSPEKESALADKFEGEYYAAYWQEVERSARAMLPEED